MFWVLLVQDTTYPEIPDAQAHLRDIYLSKWTDYAPLSQLQKAYALIPPLAALHEFVHFIYEINAMKTLFRQEPAPCTYAWRVQKNREAIT